METVNHVDIGYTQIYINRQAHTYTDTQEHTETYWHVRRQTDANIGMFNPLGTSQSLWNIIIGIII